MNILGESNNQLQPVNYKPLLEKILAVLRSEKLFTRRPDQLVIDVDKIAAAVASASLPNPLGTSTFDITSATINFGTDKASNHFSEQVKQIQNHLKAELTRVVGPSSSIEQYVGSLVKDLSSFTGPVSGLGFSYPFQQQYELQKQRLYFESSKAPSTSLLKFHKLTITVRDTEKFRASLEAGIRNSMQKRFAATSEEIRNDLEDAFQEMLESKDSDMHRLAHVVDTETLARLKRDAQIRYLDFLKGIVETGRKTGNDLDYLRDLARRLQIIDDYINDEFADDGEYEVSYSGDQSEKVINYREIFSRSDAFDMLPIIPLIKGYLGEITDDARGERRFIFGIKLKLNGKVPAHESGRLSVFDYYLNLIDPDGPEYKEAIKTPFKSESFKVKILKIVFLYYLVFSNFGQLDYDPLPAFKEKVLKVLKEGDQAAKENLLRSIKRNLAVDKSKTATTVTVRDKIASLRKLLKETVKRTSHEKQLYSRRICVKKGILLNDPTRILTERKFFKDVLGKNTREALEYISIEDAHASTSALCDLSATIAIESVYYFQDEQIDKFQMKYDIAGFKTLPILLTSRERECTNLFNTVYKKHKLIIIPHEHARRETFLKTLNSPQAFAYTFTFSLLTYLCLKIVLDGVRSPGKQLFIPLVRFHIESKESATHGESFMRSFSKVLAHLLCEDYLANAQGFSIKDKLQYKVQNGLSSLYSVLPKIFQFKKSDIPVVSSAEYIQSARLNKLAIIVVSSRESDARRTSEQKITNLMGESIGVERREDGTLRLETLTTFSANRNIKEMYGRPSALKDEVEKCYAQGYKHIIYIAQAPYSSTLHMTKGRENEGLFFMSREVIQFLKSGRSDLKIYPIFYDEYNVVKLGQPNVNSLYIQDVQELMNLVEDPSKKAVVFFNLFNGITLPGNEEERTYNGVISYTTWLNMYAGILDDADLFRGLIYTGSLKDDLLDCLMFLHFSRYEAVPRKDRPISFKLDPYDNIIGTDSVGPLALFPHMDSGARFNCLAFLTEVRRIVNLP